MSCTHVLRYFLLLIAYHPITVTSQPICKYCYKTNNLYIEKINDSNNIISFDSARKNYILQCLGCHGNTGQSVPEVPILKGKIGFFLHTQKGREFIARVPGVALSPLNDEDLAAVLNWMLQAFSKNELPVDYHPYSSDEINKLRANPVNNFTDERNAIINDLLFQNVINSSTDLYFDKNGRY